MARFFGARHRNLAMPGCVSILAAQQQGMRVYGLAYRRECRAIAGKSRRGWRRKRTKATRKKQAGGLLLV